MEDQRISLETAILAKEKGFDELCKHYWVETLEHQLDVPRSGIETFSAWEPRILSFKPVGKHEIIHALAPTQSLLQKWLREVHGIHITILGFVNGSYWYFKIYNLNKIIIDIDFDIPVPKIGETYEEVLENGLQEALKLITNK